MESERRARKLSWWDRTLRGAEVLALLSVAAFLAQGLATLRHGDEVLDHQDALTKKNQTAFERNQVAAQEFQERLSADVFGSARTKFCRPELPVVGVVAGREFCSNPGLMSRLALTLDQATTAGNKANARLEELKPTIEALTQAINDTNGNVNRQPNGLLPVWTAAGQETVTAGKTVNRILPKAEEVVDQVLVLMKDPRWKPVADDVPAFIHHMTVSSAKGEDILTAMDEWVKRITNPKKKALWLEIFKIILGHSVQGVVTR